MSQDPPAPTYILRGHSASVHSLIFLNSNSSLASGDSDGWVVLWSLATKRPLGVWKAHDSGIIGIQSWEPDRILTDHKLRVWQINYKDVGLNTRLPVDGATPDQPSPWLLYSMDISALNFCAFATCRDPWNESTHCHGILIANPNGLDEGSVDIFQLPSQHRVSQLHSDKSHKTGMVMAVKLFFVSGNNSLRLLSGYEDGSVVLHQHSGPFERSGSRWTTLTSIKLHSQPVLSLELSPDMKFFLTSSADAQIAKVALPDESTAARPAAAEAQKSVNTKHAGQQGLQIRSDGKVFATAGWDARVRIYSCKTMSELAVLKWHKDGCHSTAFAEIHDASHVEPTARTVDDSQGLTTTSPLDVFKLERSLKAQNIHWLAVGGKDGKISLWDIY